MSDTDLDSSVTPSEQSRETTERNRVRTMYQRKVMITYTRAESELLRTILTRLATDPDALESVGVAATTTAQRRARSLWKKTDRRIERRDRAMARKSHARGWPEPSTIDIPLEGI